MITPGETDQFMPLVLAYVRGLTPTIPFMILNTLMIPIVQLDGNRKTIAISAFVLCITIIAGDIIVVTLTSLGLLDPASESYAMAVRGLRWYSLCLLPLTLTVILAYYLQSAKQKLLPRIIFFADGFGALAIFAFFLTHFIDLDGLWLSFFLGKSAVLIGTLIYICAKRKTLRPTVSDLLLLPKDFDVPPEDMLILTIDNDRAVTATSERIMKFCTARGIEYRRSYFAGLALEEMVAIIAEKGFGNNRKYNIDIKVFITDGQIDIRLRDNFMYFDTAKRMEIMNSEDGISNIGIRIINSISHDTEYYSTLNVNYLVMHIAPQKQIPAQPKASLSLS